MTTDYKAFLSPQFSADDIYTIASNATGDFITTADLQNLLSSAIEQIRQVGGLGVTLLQAPANADYLRTATGSFARQAENSFTQNSALAQRQGQQLGVASSSPHRSGINNATPTKPAPQSPVPKTTLFEACTINQPLNASLRDRCSTGTYYFLK